MPRDRRDLSAWLEHPVSTASTAAFAGVVWLIVVYTTDWMVGYEGLYLAAGIGIVSGFAWL